jgi:hypothetical protein
LARIRDDPAKFVALLDDPEAKGGPVTLPDGSVAPRLPGFRRWLWDGGFCGSITSALHRGVISILRIHAFVAYRYLWKIQRGVFVL